jgi:hypothetical protein
MITQNKMFASMIENMGTEIGKRAKYLQLSQGFIIMLNNVRRIHTGYRAYLVTWL